MTRCEVIGDARLYLGDCLDVLRTLENNSLDSIVTDPPYGLSFMGKKWDYDVPSVEVWAECLRVLKPGGHLLAFAGTRTQHRMAVRIEDAGFEIRDMIAWVYGSGFPKSLDVSKAIDKAAGAKPVETGEFKRAIIQRNGSGDSWAAGAFASHPEETKRVPITAPATPSARQWQGWGTALKPALEPVTVARKPLSGTVASNVLEHGTGALNIDRCRVGDGDVRPLILEDYKSTINSTYQGRMDGSLQGGSRRGGETTQGRWPANLIHDGSEEVVGLFPGEGEKTAARFMYCAKASKRDRDDGLEGFPVSVQQSVAHGERAYGTLPYTGEQREIKPRPRANHHPTVKPTDLMRYLCRLVTPPGGVVLDPFMGSGSTGKAAVLEGFQFIGIEREPKYFDIACKRIEQAVAQGQLFTPEPTKHVQESML